MKITKKIQCKKCQVVVTENGSCACGNLTLANENVFIKEGVMGLDAIDVSAKLLNE